MNQKKKYISKTAYEDFQQMKLQKQFPQQQQRQSLQTKQGFSPSIIQQQASQDHINLHGNIENSLQASSQIMKQGFLEEGFSLLKKLEYIVIVSEQKRKNMLINNNSGISQKEVSNNNVSQEAQNLLSIIMNNLGFYYHMKQKSYASTLYATKAVEYDKLYQNTLDQQQEQVNHQSRIFQQQETNSDCNQRAQQLEFIISQLNFLYKILSKPNQNAESKDDDISLIEPQIQPLIDKIRQLKSNKNIYNTTCRLLIVQVVNQDIEVYSKQQILQQCYSSYQIEIEALALYYSGILYQKMNMWSLTIQYLTSALEIFQQLYLTSQAIYQPFIASIKQILEKEDKNVSDIQLISENNEQIVNKKKIQQGNQKSIENKEINQSNQIIQQTATVMPSQSFQNNSQKIQQNEQQQINLPNFIQMQYKENQGIQVNKQNQILNGSIHISQNLDVKKDDTQRITQKRNSLSHERNEIIQLKNLYQTENMFVNKSNNQKDHLINQDISSNPISISSYVINQRRGDFYSPREEDKYKSFKSAIASKLFQSNQQSPAYTPRNSGYGNNSSRENSQTCRLRTGRLKVTQDSKNQNNLYHNVQSNSQQYESSDAQVQQLAQQQIPSQQETPFQNQFPANQQKILNLIMNNSSQKKMKQFVQKNGLTNLLNQQKQGQLIQILKQNQTNLQPSIPKTTTSATLSQNSSSTKHSKKQSSYLEQSQVQQTTNVFNSSRSSQKNNETNFINNSNEQNTQCKQSLLEELYQSIDSLNYIKNNKQSINKIQKLQIYQQQTKSQQNQSNELNNSNNQNCKEQSQKQHQKGSQQKQIQTNIQDKFIHENQVTCIKQISGTEPLMYQTDLNSYGTQSLYIKPEQLQKGMKPQNKIIDQQFSGLKQSQNVSEQLSRKVSLGSDANQQQNNSNINSNKTNWQTFLNQKSGFVNNNYNNIYSTVNNNNNFSRNVSIHMITPNKSKSTTSSNNGTTEKTPISKQIYKSNNGIQQQINQESFQLVQEKESNSQQQKSLQQQSNIQTKQKDNMLSRITTQANTTIITTNNSNHMNNNNSTNNWDNNTSDSLYFQKKIKEINKIENLFHRKDSLPEGTVLLQNYSSKKQDPSSKRYVMDDTDIPIAVGQNDDLNSNFMQKRDVQTARKKSVKQKNLFNNQEKNIYQMALKNICNFPIKVSHSIGKIKNDNTNTLNTRRSSINSQFSNTNTNSNSKTCNNNNSNKHMNPSNNQQNNSNSNSNNKQNINLLNQQKADERNQNNFNEDQYSTQLTDNQQQQHIQKSQINQQNDFDMNVFNSFITNNTQQFQISLAKRINSKLNYLKERIEKQKEENQNIKNALKRKDNNKIHASKVNKNQISQLSVNSSNLSHLSSSLSSISSSSSISS